MKKFSTLLAILCLTACQPAASSSNAAASGIDLSAQLPTYEGQNIWTVNYEESDLTFSATHNSREFQGNFSKFAASIKLDPTNVEQGSISVAVDLSSVDAGDRDRNQNLPSKAWFDTANFPVAMFVSGDIQSLGEDNYKANGDLSLKGITHPVVLVFSLQVDGDNAVATGGADLNRTDFGVGEGPDFSVEDWVKFPVAVQFTLKATR